MLKFSGFIFNNIINYIILTLQRCMSICHCQKLSSDKIEYKQVIEVRKNHRAIIITGVIEIQQYWKNRSMFAKLFVFYLVPIFGVAFRHSPAGSYSSEYFAKLQALQKQCNECLMAKRPYHAIGYEWWGNILK